MENTKIYTDVEILTNSINTINSIQIPIGQMETIGFPLNVVVKNLQSLLDAIINSQKKQTQQEPEPEIEFIPAEEVPEDEQKSEQ